MKNIYKIAGFAATLAGLLLAFAATASAATLTLTPSSQNLNVGDSVTVQIMLDTGGQAIDGVDIQALNYNPYFLQIQDADNSTAGTQIQAGSLMPNTLANSVDTTNGKIVFSQVTAGGTTYKGSGLLASITFKALVAGTAKLTLDFTPGSTVDCNVASQGSDILSSVTNAQYTISNIGSSVTGNSGNSGTNGSNAGGLTIPTAGGSSNSTLRLINSSGTYYLIMNNVRHGITNPGMLYTYGFTFDMGKSATADDLAL
ncbi:MAG: cohesin domain-containing protein, partial [Candidatus Doudnabacteria bacterium]|nr:cohesin domain-containing protein [Candidatus Doudnabacteria bacterium]